MNLAAFTAGVDRPQGTREETLHLYAYLMLFIEGATLAHYTGDRDGQAGRGGGRRSRAFDAEFLAPVDRPAPGAARRGRRRDRATRTTCPATCSPRCCATTTTSTCRPTWCCARSASSCSPAPTPAPPRSSARCTTCSRWPTTGPSDLERARTDLAFLQRCVHETVRLQPSSPIAMRWALADVDLPGGVHVPDRGTPGHRPDGGEPRPDGVRRRRRRLRPAPPAAEPGVAPWGLSFGLGMHACIGQDLAAGIDPMGQPVDDDHLYGLVPVAIRALLDAGGRPDPDDPPTMDPDSSRGYWGRYPVRVPA